MPRRASKSNPTRMMPKRYLFFVSLPYAYPILRPLESEILRRGGEVAWFLEKECKDLLAPADRRLRTLREVRKYNPIAVFAPGNNVYDFFPGVKVCLFHGYPINKRREHPDNHFRLRGWFDILCTQGPSSTGPFQRLADELGYFKVYETGWCKVDGFLPLDTPTPAQQGKRPTILYASTFTKGISSIAELCGTIDRLAAEKPWDWIITTHPKYRDWDVINRYFDLAKRHPNVRIEAYANNAETYRQCDAMLCDNSSIIVEFMLFGRPVVTFRNWNPGSHLINVSSPGEVGPALELALTRPDGLMRSIDEYTSLHEAHRDGHNSARVLDAVDDFIANYKGRLRRRPLNLLRRIKLRWRLKKFIL